MYYTGLAIYWGVLTRIIAILVRVETDAATYGLVTLGQSSPDPGRVLVSVVDNCRCLGSLGR